MAVTRILVSMPQELVDRLDDLAADLRGVSRSAYVREYVESQPTRAEIDERLAAIESMAGTIKLPLDWPALKAERDRRPAA